MAMWHAFAHEAFTDRFEPYPFFLGRNKAFATFREARAFALAEVERMAEAGGDPYVRLLKIEGCPARSCKGVNSHVFRFDREAGKAYSFVW